MPEKVTPSRLAALEVLRRVRGGELADRALERALERLPERERGWTVELVYGTFRLRGRLDFYLDALVRGGVETLDADVLEVLRLGAYQLLEMESVPPYAAVSQSVELVRAAGGRRAAGLVNGVLQSLRRRGGEVRFPDRAFHPAGYLSAWHSHPRWLVDRWVGIWGVEETEVLLEVGNRRPELYLRPLGLSAPEALARLEAAGVEAETVPLSPDSLRVLPPAGAVEALEAAPAVVQDPAAALVVRYASVPERGRVLDLCAAPGGKALGMAERAGYVAAADLSPGRLRRVRENAERVGATGRVGVVAADARHPPFREAELVLIDAPCTGTGTFRRHPDGRWRVTERDLSALVALQREILEAAAPLVCPGGWLVYATCSLEPEENRLQVEGFLRSHPEFTADPPEGAVAPELLDGEGWLTVLPHRSGFDGSFAARLRRRT
jgi:16S rRNA (cytosine967-C5)-methyltransferase